MYNVLIAWLLKWELQTIMSSGILIDIIVLNVI